MSFPESAIFSEMFSNRAMSMNILKYINQYIQFIITTPNILTTQQKEIIAHQRKFNFKKENSISKKKSQYKQNFILSKQK